MTKGASRSPSDGGRSRSRARGQTTLDFAIGVSIFLVVVAFVLTFVPSIFVPFVDTDRTQGADRAATALATNELAHPSKPYLLDKSCTVDFFNRYDDGSGQASESCRFDTTNTTLNGVLGLVSTVQTNVTIETLDGTVISLNGVDLRAGQRVPAERGVTTARRTVRLAGQTRRLIVRIW